MHLLLPYERLDRVLRTLRRPLEILLCQPPLAHSRFDRGDLPVRLARLTHCVHVREPVRPLEVRDDDHLV